MKAGNAVKSNILTINETAKRLKNDNIGVTSYTLRMWVKTGKLPHRKAGSKVLLYYPNVVEFLCCQAGKETTKEEQDLPMLNGIRRVGVS